MWQEGEAASLFCLAFPDFTQSFINEFYVLSLEFSLLSVLLQPDFPLKP